MTTARICANARPPCSRSLPGSPLGRWCCTACCGGGRDLIIDSAPILAWRRRDPDAALGHASAHHERPLLSTAVQLYHLRPHVIRLDTGYWGLKLIA